jgi:DNA-binding MarR family transcriptional regulator
VSGPPGLDDWLSFQVFKCGWWLQFEIERRLEPTGIGGRHFMVLTMLDAPEPLSQREMAAVMSLAPGLMVALIDDLEDDGLCARSRDPRDRRRHVVTLTAKGRRVLERSRKIVHEVEEEVFATLTAAEREQLGGLMDRVMAPYWDAKQVTRA